VHDDYVRAGADILTACTFRTNRYTLARRGLAHEAGSLTREMVAMARRSAELGHKAVLVAGSIAPLQDCYYPERTPDDSTLAREHAAHAESLAIAGADLLLVETMPTLREASCAARAAAATGLPVIVSLLVGAGRRMQDGTALPDALGILAQHRVALLSVNCGPPSWCSEAMQDLRESGCRFGAYANSSTPDGSFGHMPQPIGVQDYAQAVGGWLRAGASLVGGCCGTGPAHIQALRRQIDSMASHQAGGAQL
jgi:S-methylmethionine-dependent homocysteine/selenocysteine methylase